LQKTSAHTLSVISFQEPHLNHLLGFMGLTDVTFIHAEKMGFGPDARGAALRSAKQKIEAVVAGALAKAA
jgi:FMN-dependent NADH-azoreductase